MSRTLVSRTCEMETNGMTDALKYGIWIYSEVCQATEALVHSYRDVIPRFLIVSLYSEANIWWPAVTRVFTFWHRQLSTRWGRNGCGFELEGFRDSVKQD